MNGRVVPIRGKGGSKPPKQQLTVKVSEVDQNSTLKKVANFVSVAGAVSLGALSILHSRQKADAVKAASMLRKVASPEHLKNANMLVRKANDTLEMANIAAVGMFAGIGSRIGLASIPNTKVLNIGVSRKKKE